MRRVPSGVPLHAIRPGGCIDQHDTKPGNSVVLPHELEVVGANAGQDQGAVHGMSEESFVVEPVAAVEVIAVNGPADATIVRQRRVHKRDDREARVKNEAAPEHATRVWMT